MLVSSIPVNKIYLKLLTELYLNQSSIQSVLVVKNGCEEREDIDGNRLTKGVIENAVHRGT